MVGDLTPRGYSTEFEGLASSWSSSAVSCLQLAWLFKAHRLISCSLTNWLNELMAKWVDVNDITSSRFEVDDFVGIPLTAVNLADVWTGRRQFFLQVKETEILKTLGYWWKRKASPQVRFISQLQKTVECSHNHQESKLLNLNAKWHGLTSWEFQVSTCHGWCPWRLQEGLDPRGWWDFSLDFSRLHTSTTFTKSSFTGLSSPSIRFEQFSLTQHGYSIFSCPKTVFTWGNTKNYLAYEKLSITNFQLHSFILALKELDDLTHGLCFSLAHSNPVSKIQGCRSGFLDRSLPVHVPFGDQNS